MVIKKDEIQHILDDMPDNVDIEEVFDRILISAKIEAAIEQSEQGLGEDFEDFKNEWLKEN